MDNKYLCIGGPLHGQLHALYNGARELTVPEYDRDWIGTCGVEPTDPCPLRQSRYTLTDIGLNEQRTQTSPYDSLSVTIECRVIVKVLAHESVLTIEELSAYFRKLKPRAVRDGVTHVLSAMKLASPA